jgi:hypothetical protein
MAKDTLISIAIILYTYTIIPFKSSFSYIYKYPAWTLKKEKRVFINIAKARFKGNF